MSALTDSRLHFHVRLCLEYKTHDVSRLALRVLTGDEKRQCFLDACDQCMNDFALAKRQPLLTERLRRSHETVLTLARDHLYNVCDKCTEHVKRTRSRIVSCTRAVDRQCSRAERRYAHSGDGATYTHELRRLQHELDHVLDAERSGELPRVERPERLVRHMEKLQDTFRTLVDSGTLSRRALEQDKKNIHDSLLYMQRSIAAKFLSDLKDCVATTDNAS